MSETLNAEGTPAVAVQRVVSRLGRFKISGCLLRDWEKLLPLFGQLVIVRCEYLWSMDAAEYTAYSKLFEEVPEGCMPPEYEITCHNDALGTRFSAKPANTKLTRAGDDSAERKS